MNKSIVAGDFKIPWKRRIHRSTSSLHTKAMWDTNESSPRVERACAQLEVHPYIYLGRKGVIAKNSAIANGHPRNSSTIHGTAYGEKGKDGL